MRPCLSYARSNALHWPSIWLRQFSKIFGYIEIYPYGWNSFDRQHKSNYKQPIAKPLLIAILFHTQFQESGSNIFWEVFHLSQSKVSFKFPYNYCENKLLPFVTRLWYAKNYRTPLLFHFYFQNRFHQNKKCFFWKLMNCMNNINYYVLIARRFSLNESL